MTTRAPISLYRAARTDVEMASLETFRQRCIATGILNRAIQERRYLAYQHIWNKHHLSEEQSIERY